MLQSLDNGSQQFERDSRFRPMFLDTATLYDLDVVTTPTALGPTLLGMVDRTRTRAGREQLRHRLITPAHADEAILARQRAHQVLASEALGYRTAIDRADTDGVERYLNSNWQLPDARSGLARVAERLWRPAWYRAYLQDVGDGQSRIVALLNAASELRTPLNVAGATVLRQVGERIAALIDTADAHELSRLGMRHSATTQIAFDQFARGRAKPLLAELIECVGTVEAMWSLAVATVEHGWSYPRPGSRLSVTGLFHPFLGQQAVATDLDLNARVRVCFVTGPNMAGKSTFLKAVAVALLLAHAGCGVPATSMEFPTVGTIFSSVQIIDNLSAGESFYLAEVRRIRALAQALHDHGSAVAVVDEPFRGTNVHDAAEATLAVMTRLADHPRALVFIASHVGEVVPAIGDDPRISLCHFAADVTAEQPRFDYRLREGVSAQRLGMTLLKQERVLDLLERSAESPDMERHGAARASSVDSRDGGRV